MPDACAIGESIRKDIADLTNGGVKSVKFLQIYKISGKPAKNRVDFICRNILIDPVTQYASIRKSLKKDNYHAIEVWYKKGVTDSVGESVKKAIEDIGIENIESVSTGKKYILEGALDKDILKEIATKLLANSVVEDYYII